MKACFICLFFGVIHLLPVSKIALSEAQSITEEDYNPLNSLTGAKRKVLAENASLYLKPNERAVGERLGFEELTLVEEAGSAAMSGLQSKWLKVSRRIAGREEPRYVREIDLAMVRLPLEAGSVDAIAGVRGATRDVNGATGVAFDVKVTKNGKLLAESSFRPVLTEFGDPQVPRFGYSVSMRRIPPSGLAKVKDIIVLDIFYEACGYTSSKYYFLFTGTKLHGPIELPYGGEAGMYSFSANAILPDDSSGVPNGIIVESSSTTYEGEEELSKKTKRSFWNWDGERLIRKDTQLSRVASSD